MLGQIAMNEMREMDSKKMRNKSERAGVESIGFSSQNTVGLFGKWCASILNKPIYLTFFVCIGLLVTLSAHAQDLEIEEDGEVQTGEIVIEKDRKIVLPQARKLYEKVQSPEFESEAVSIPAKFKTFSYNPAVQLPDLKAAQPENDGTKEDIYDHYVKAGFGNFTSPLLQADFNLITDDTKVFRAKLDHLSFGNGAKDGKNSASSYSDVGVDGKIVGDNMTFSTGVGYTTTTDYFYGYQPGLEIDRENIRHKYDFLRASIGVEDNDAENEVDYALAVRYNSVKDNYSASESGVTIGTGFNYTKTFFVDGEFIFSKYDQNTFSLNRNFFRINPYYRLLAGGVTVDAGFSFTSAAANGEPFGSSAVFPFGRANYAVSDYVDLFARLDGGISFNSYEGYARANPYLMQDLLVNNSRVNYDFMAGAALKANESFSIKVHVGLQSVKNMEHFRSVLPDTTTFEVTYIPGNTKILELGSKVQVNINDQNQVALNAAILNYSSKDLDEFYHLPTSKIELTGEHGMMDKLTIGWQFNLLGGINGLQSNGTAPGSESTVKLAAITELNLYFDYQINERVGAFLQFNNILNKNYERYINYPMRGLQVKAGASFRF